MANGYNVLWFLHVAVEEERPGWQMEIEEE